MTLQQENNTLKKQLAQAKLWMKREVESKVQDIMKTKIATQAWQEKQVFFSEQQKQIVEQQITHFLLQDDFLQIDGEVLEHLVSAECLFLYLKTHRFSDGIGCVVGYQKAIERVIEGSISCQFRSFAKKQRLGKPENIILEKGLYAVVEEGKSLGIGKVFHILKLLHSKQKAGVYTDCFHLFLEKYSYIGEVLLHSSFFEQLTGIMNLEVFSEKRHKGKVSFEEAELTRKYVVGDVKEKECLLYQLLALEKI